MLFVNSASNAESHSTFNLNQRITLEKTLQNPDASMTSNQLFWRGVLAMIPLNVAVIPWGLLAGTLAVDAGLPLLEGQALSAILFAGAAQLVALGMIKAGAGLFSILLTTFFITSRHFLYSMSMRDRISHLPLRWRVTLGFLMTDELFAVVGHHDKKSFQPWYALGAALSMYLLWNIATLVGIFAGHQIPALNDLGLEFAVAATFIAIVVPGIVSLPVLVAVLVALVMSVTLAWLSVDGGLIIASITAMIAGYMTERWSTSP